ncbi:unnamed protein product [Paramecium primaurelia]|uniref:RING-type domain-containing protein n=1 Tax=Paramecium primaurelia TaxID=5886 RepID=A0A8S1Q184_PARPR|nr:unnamed protein product [Paramecium primaurelia]
MINNKQQKQQLPIVIQKYEDSLRDTKGSYMYDHSLSVERENYYQSKNKISIRSSSNCQQQKNEKERFLCSLIPSPKNIKYQKSKFTFNTEEINKHNQKLKTDVQLLYQLINLEQQKPNKIQIPQKTLQKSKLIDSIQKDKNGFISNSQIIENCQVCKKSRNDKIVQTTCDHFYHYDCFQQYLEICIKKGHPQIYCHCKTKIPQQIILNNTNLLIIQRYFHNQYQKLQIKYFKYYNFQKCINSFCNFFWIRTNENNKRKTSIFSYCPNCLNKNFEIGLQMEQIFYKF